VRRWKPYGGPEVSDPTPNDPVGSSTGAKTTSGLWKAHPGARTHQLCLQSLEFHEWSDHQTNCYGHLSNHASTRE